MMTETIETNADNSMEIETQEPENAPETSDNADTDNSDNGVVNDKEPVETNGQFNDLAEANKAYAELRKLNGEQSTELGELRKLKEEFDAKKMQEEAEALKNAQNNGFNSVIEYENHEELVNFIADEFEKNIAECSYPDEVRNLIQQYRKSADDTILKTIKNEFDVDTIEKIALASKDKENELYQNVIKQVQASAGAFLQKNINENADRFQNPAFAELYGEAFLALGENLDTQRFITLLDNYTTSLLKRNQINQGIVNDNVNATNEIAGLSGGNYSTNSNINEKDILSMSDSEMKKEIFSKI